MQDSIDFALSFLMHNEPLTAVEAKAAMEESVPVADAANVAVTEEDTQDTFFKIVRIHKLSFRCDLAPVRLTMIPRCVHVDTYAATPTVS